MSVECLEGGFDGVSDVNWQTNVNTLMVSPCRR